mmetsp:Transcript_27826/g.83180  ORF Transcript_27826/g.83180 Transcript_27826/m.83180 type:complete len:202 (-) Transcript_27826:199-804(-)
MRHRGVHVHGHDAARDDPPVPALAPLTSDRPGERGVDVLGALVQASKLGVRERLPETLSQGGGVRVLGQVELVAARLRRRQLCAVVLRQHLDLERGEADRRQVRAGGDEVEEGAPLGVRHRLQLVDEELVHLGVLRIPARRQDVPRQLRLGPLDRSGAAERRAQLGQREGREPAERKHLVEARAKGGRLLGDAVGEPQLGK